mmetsp:Transcript_12367/g.33382  ORF Transcript_12367/g.33382 Transcript_12367/m.33382 type:complete len:150 (-) Transcript_12367:961-1410(-)
MISPSEFEERTVDSMVVAEGGQGISQGKTVRYGVMDGSLPISTVPLRFPGGSGMESERDAGGKPYFDSPRTPELGAGRAAASSLPTVFAKLRAMENSPALGSRCPTTLSPLSRACTASDLNRTNSDTIELGAREKLSRWHENRSRIQRT